MCAKTNVSKTQQCMKLSELGLTKNCLKMPELGLTNWSELGLTDVELLRLHNDAVTVHKIHRPEDLDRAA